LELEVVEVFRRRSFLEEVVEVFRRRSFLEEVVEVPFPPQEAVEEVEVVVPFPPQEAVVEVEVEVEVLRLQDLLEEVSVQSFCAPNWLVGVGK
jgi:predicted metalloenzyme YecM